MKLYIQIQDGKPINHPSYETSLLETFGKIPNDWELFVRTPKPVVPTNLIVDPSFPFYEKINGVWTDVWNIRKRTEEEFKPILEDAARYWASIPFSSNFSSWIYDVSKDKYVPPIEKPKNAPDGMQYRWNGKENNWKLAPKFPNDGKLYRFNFDTWENEEVANEQTT